MWNARTFADIQRSLGPQTLLIYLWSDVNATFTWLIGRDSLTFHETPTSRRTLASDIRRLAEKPDDVSASNAVYQALFQPFSNELGEAKRIVIVATGSLEAIPFAALKPRDGNPMIDVASLVVAPSANVYLEAKAHQKQTLRSALLVANATNGTDTTLERLNYRPELAAITKAFRNLTVLLDSDATPSRAVTAAVGCDLLHFSAHGMDSSPQYAEPVLLLTPDIQAPDGALRASYVARQSVGRGSVVVLAACRTLTGDVKGEGTLSMGRSFIEAGAGAVVATLWDVDDAATVNLFRDFYRAIAGGSDAADALRAAQQAMMKDPQFNSPRYWAAFQVYGGI